MTQKLAIATISWARDAEEEALLKKSLERLAELNIPVTVADGGSNADFISFLKSFPHFEVLQPTARGLFQQVKASLQAAAAKTCPDFIFYTEPDKYEFFANLSGITKSFLMENHDKLGVRLMTRSHEAFKTFPSFQQSTETCINQCCSEVMGRPDDYTYGPFFIRPSIIPSLEHCTNEAGWGWRPYVFAIAHRHGLRVDSIEGNFECPPSQRHDQPSERIYRMQQMIQSVQGLLLATKVPLSNL